MQLLQNRCCTMVHQLGMPWKHVNPDMQNVVSMLTSEEQSLHQAHCRWMRLHSSAQN